VLYQDGRRSGKYSIDELKHQFENDYVLDEAEKYVQSREARRLKAQEKARLQQ